MSQDKGLGTHREAGRGSMSVDSGAAHSALAEGGRAMNPPSRRPVWVAASEVRFASFVLDSEWDFSFRYRRGCVRVAVIPIGCGVEVRNRKSERDL